MTKLVKEDYLQRWSQIFQSDKTELVRFIWFLIGITGIFGLNSKHPRAEEAEADFPTGGSDMYLSWVM